MDRGHDPGRKLRFEDFSAFPRDAKGRAEERLGRGRAEADESFWPNDTQFRFHPGPAGGDITRIWLLMNAAFPARLPFEVLDRVRHVNRVAIDPRVFQRAIEKLAGRGNGGALRCCARSAFASVIRFLIPVIARLVFSKFFSGASDRNAAGVGSSILM